MNQEIIRTELAKMRTYLEDRGIIKLKKSPEDNLEEIEKMSEESNDNLKESDLGF